MVTTRRAAAALSSGSRALAVSPTISLAAARPAAAKSSSSRTRKSRPHNSRVAVVVAPEVSGAATTASVTYHKLDGRSLGQGMRELEETLASEGAVYTVGVDEAGRGPLVCNPNSLSLRCSLLLTRAGSLCAVRSSGGGGV